MLRTKTRWERRALKALTDNRAPIATVKESAAPGESEISFEQSFAALAHQTIKEKAAKLLPYELGFSLIKKNSEGTRACGAFGFLIGNKKWVYCPVFFINGELKGLEMMFLPDQNIFVPMDETWVDAVIGQSQAPIGSSIDQAIHQRNMEHPNIRDLARPPLAKSGEAGFIYNNNPNCRGFVAPQVPTWGINAAKAMAKAALNALPEFKIDPLAPARHANQKEAEDLFRYLASEAPAVLYYLAKQAGVRKGPGSMYFTMEDCGPLTSEKAVKALSREMTDAQNEMITEFSPRLLPRDRQRKRQQTGEKAAARLMIVYRQEVFHGPKAVEHLNSLDKEDRSALLRDGRIVKDRRDKNSLSSAYEIDKTTKLSTVSPTEGTGLYDVVIGGGKIARCLVLAAPTCKSRKQDFCTVIQIAGSAAGRRWVNIHPSQVHTVGGRLSKEEFQKFWDGLSEPKSLPQDGTVRVLLGDNGSATAPFVSIEEFNNEAAGLNDSETYRVGFCSRSMYNGAFSSSRGADYWKSTALRESENRAPYGYDQELIKLLKRPGHKVKTVGNTVVVPKGCRVLEIAGLTDDDKDDVKDAKKHRSPAHHLCFGASSSRLPLVLGSSTDLFEDIYRSHSVLEVKKASIWTPGNSVWVVDGITASHPDAVRMVANRYDLPVEATDEIFAKAADSRGAVKFVVKQADPAFAVGNLVSAPDMHWESEEARWEEPLISGSLPAAGRTVRKRAIYSLMKPVNRDKTTIAQPDLGLPSVLQDKPDREMLSLAGRAAMSGERDIADMSSFSALLSSVSREDIIGRYMGDMIRGMDRFFRLLFQAYWHSDEFADAFGDEQQRILEDELRATAQGAGRVILKLQTHAKHHGMPTDETVDVGSESIND